MEWIIPAISIDCGFKLAVALILFVRYFEIKEKVILCWAMGWLFFGFHAVTELVIIGTEYEPFWFIRHIFFAFTAVAFLESVGHMQRPVLKIWHIFAAVVGLGAIITSYTGVFVVGEWSAAAIPASFLNGIGFIVCAFYFLKFTRGQKSPARLPIFLGFLLNGLHNLDYPFLRPVAWFAPIGFSLGVVFSIIFAIGLIMMSTEELKRQREKSQHITRDLSVLNSISTIASQTLNLEEILNNVLDKILEAVNVKSGYIFLLNEEAKELNLSAARGVSKEYERKIAKLELDQDTLCSIVARKGEPIVIEDISEHRGLKTEAIDKEGFRSFGCVPLKSKEKVMGVMSIISDKPRQFTPGEIQLLVSIGNEVGVAIENAELYKKLKNWSKELERIITERTKDLADARRATLNMLEDISEAYTQLKDTQTQLVQSEKMAAIGRIAANVSHEIRNPLTGIKVSVYYLSNKLTKSSPKITKTIKNMEKEIERASNIINNILEFSRPPKLELNATDVNIVIEKTLSAAQKEYQLKNIEIIKKLTSDIPKIPLDSLRFRQVLDNIILNASQSMSKGGKLTVETLIVNNKLEVRITDSGIGIAKENLEDIFEPFFTSKHTGVGLGLAIVKEIIKGHQGSIKAESKVGEGSTFVISLPLKKES